ncbi:MAG TPA: hypothetical protein VFB81_09355 [Myxococcales bacterium]|nr:hypothetical protein [Myxococcales bacterium]
MSTDAKGTKILARTFFQQLRQGGYTPNQIIAVATELIDLVTTELRVNSAAVRSTEVTPATTPAPMPPLHVRPPSA